MKYRSHSEAGLETEFCYGWEIKHVSYHILQYYFIAYSFLYNYEHLATWINKITDVVPSFTRHSKRDLKMKSPCQNERLGIKNVLFIEFISISIKKILKGL